MYTPVLRWRSAEKDALRKLGAADAEATIPLIEVVPAPGGRYGDEPRRSYMQQVVDEVGDIWQGKKAFLDAALLKPYFLIEGRSPLQAAVRHGLERGFNLIPVVRLARTGGDPENAVFASARERDRGCALRLRPVDLDLAPAKFQRLLDDLMRHLRVDPEQVDLIMDEEFTFPESIGYETLCGRLPRLDEWRSFTILSGDFPADLQEFTRATITPKRRGDWQRWQTQNASSLPRRPHFGDYTVQYAAYRTFPPGEVPNPSVSVRYTTEDTWLICRGEARRDGGPGLEQWIGWAQLLVRMPEFKGADFSAGDRYIAERATGLTTTGSFTTWISAGINHHLTLAARQSSTHF